MVDVFRVVVVLFALVCGNLFGSDSDYLNRLLPVGVSMGMSGSEMPALKNTIRRPIVGDRQLAVGDYDLIHRINPATFSWLYFRDDKLVGQMRITKSSLLSNDEQQAECDLALPVSMEGFLKEADEEVLRVGPNLEPVVVTATKWKSGSSNLTFYTVMTDTEITAIAFDSSKISKDIFLSSPLLKKDLEAESKVIMQKIEANRQAASSGITSQVAQSSISQATSNSPTSTPTIPSKVREKFVLSPFSIVASAIIAAGIVGVIVFLLRRK